MLWFSYSRNNNNRDFPGHPVVETSPSNAGGSGLISGRGAKIAQTSHPKKTKHKKKPKTHKKQKQYCNKFNKDFKNGPHKKKTLKKRKETATNNLPTNNFSTPCNKLEERYCYCDRCGGALLHMDQDLVDHVN